MVEEEELLKEEILAKKDPQEEPTTEKDEEVVVKQSPEQMDRELVGENPHQGRRSSTARLSARLSAVIGSSFRASAWLIALDKEAGGYTAGIKRTYCVSMTFFDLQSGSNRLFRCFHSSCYSMFRPLYQLPSQYAS